MTRTLWRDRKVAVGLFLLAILGGSGPLAAQEGAEPESAIPMPARFMDGRIYVRPVTASGDTLLFFTDTGGGVLALYEPVVDSLALPVEERVTGSGPVRLVPWPRWSDDAAVPAPGAAESATARLRVMPVQGSPAAIAGTGDAGFLGAPWFAGRVWTFDYPAERLLLRSAGDVSPPGAGSRVTLGFQSDSAGRRTSHFPRIPVVVDGDTLDLLFDTGATMVLRDSALAAMGDGGPALRASSFISAAVFDGWRERHPDWPVIEAATTFPGAALIRVPAVEIAGLVVGPAWFESRPHGVFERGLSRAMDRPVVGALGGNVLGHFRVTVDYPAAVAIFETPEAGSR